MKQILVEKPEKKEMISKNLIEMVKNCMKKDIINLDLVHTALLEALEISSQKDIDVYVYDIMGINYRNWSHYLKSKSNNWCIQKMVPMQHVYYSHTVRQKIGRQW